MAMEWNGILAAAAELLAAGIIVFAPSRLSHTRYVKSPTARKIAAMNSAAVAPAGGHTEHSTLSLEGVAQF